MKDESLGRVLGLTQASKVGWAISGMKQAGRGCIYEHQE